MQKTNTLVRAALENFPVQKQKKINKARKKNKSKKNVMKNNSCHPQNWLFPLSTMVANKQL
jgi:hypothetical protein